MLEDNKYLNSKAKEKNFYSEINFFKFSSNNRTFACRIFIITILVGKVIYLEKCFVSRAASGFSIYKERRCEKVFTRKSIIMDENTSTATKILENAIDAIQEKILNYEIKLGKSIYRIEVFSKNMINAAKEIQGIRQKVMDMPTRAGNNEFSILRSTLMVDRNFRGSVRSS
jgi:hypothetical protein